MSVVLKLTGGLFDLRCGCLQTGGCMAVHRLPEGSLLQGFQCRARPGEIPLVWEVGLIEGCL